jgi:ketosteroid isomerase-like protein
MRAVAGRDVAFVHTLERLAWTSKGGAKNEMRGRCTSGLEKTRGRWLIVHDHCSVPADFDTGKAVMDLKP